MAWVLSSFTSFTMATLSLSALHQLFCHDWDIGSVFYTDDRLSRFTVTFFLAFLVLDLGLGLRYYPRQIQLLTGWIHHVFYMGLLVWALRAHFTLGFALFAAEELPTFLLAVGSIYPKRRNDLLFGLVFFVTRVAYHGLLFQRVLDIKEPRVQLNPIIAMTFALHCYWMWCWVQGYRRRLRQRKQMEGGDKGL